MNGRPPPELVTEALTHYRKKVQAAPKKKNGRAVPHVITIARAYGAGGLAVAGLVGRRLDCHVWDRDILDLLADQSHGHYQAEMFRSLDERGRGAVSSLVASCLRRADDETYHYLLHRAMALIAQHDAVIVGRGGYLLLPDAFHVFIKASPEKRIQTVAERNGISPHEAKRIIEKTDHERELFIKQLISHLQIPGERLKNPFDLEISTDRLSYEDAAALICEGAERFFRNRETVGATTS